MVVSLLVETVCFLAALVYYMIVGMIQALTPWCLKPKKDVTGQIALVTGAGSGLGRLLSERFAKLGCTVVLWDINERGNLETVQRIRNLGGTAHAYTCDLSNRNAIYDAASKVKTEVGDVDILVNNAGIVTGKKFLQSPDALIEKCMEVNTNAHFWTVKAFLPSMMTRNHGHIVTIASSAGIVGVAGLADYCASKFAAVGFDETLRAELDVLEKTGVHTTVVCPYFINTGMFDGVQSRFPLLLPILDPNYAVDCMMNAVLTNQETLYIPRILYPVLALKGILPVKCSFLMARFFGASTAMETFKGRQPSKVDTGAVKKD